MEKIDFCKAEKVKGEENQMEEKKTNQQSRVAESEIIIDSVQPYRENYQMRMLKNNRIPGLLRVSGCGMEGYSISQSELSRILSHKMILGLYPAIALSDALDIDMSAVLYPDRWRRRKWDIFVVLSYGSILLL